MIAPLSFFLFYVQNFDLLHLDFDILRYFMFVFFKSIVELDAVIFFMYGGIPVLPDLMIKFSELKFDFVCLN